MPRKPDAVVIGRMDCPAPDCGERCAVFQNAKDYLYTRCPNCGADQRNGVPAQVFMWQHMDPLPGAVVKRPRNVPESAGEIGCALRGDAPVAVVEPVRSAEAPRKPAAARAEPVQVPAPVPAQEPIGGREKAKKGSTGGVVLLVVGGLLSALALAAGGQAIATGNR